MIREALRDYALKTNKEFTHDRTKTVGASEIGLCERRVWFAKHTPRATPIRETGSWGASFRGSMIEDTVWAPAIRATYGDKVLFIGKDQRTLTSGYLSATPDGLLTDTNPLKEFGILRGRGNCVLLESKTIDPRSILREAKAENRYQVQVQMGLVRETTKFKPNYAIISYINASFWDEVDEFIEKFDPKIYKVAKERAERIITAKSMDDMRPEGTFTGGSECQYCPFRKQCYERLGRVPEEDNTLDKQYVAQIEDQCREIVALEDQIKALASSVEEKKYELKEDLRKKNVRRVPDVVTWSTVKAAVRFDNKAIREAAQAAGVDVDSLKVVGEPTDRLQILVDSKR
jgi:hypothetical protein